MKKSIYIVFALFALTVSSVFIVSCDIKNPTEGLKVIVNTISRQTSVAVNISDRNGSSVSSPITIRFTGPDSANVIDEVNNKITMRSTTEGAFTFSIKDGIAISESSPVKLVLQVRSDKKDYLDVDYPLTLTTTGFQNLYVKMIKTDSLKASGIDQVNNVPTNTTADPTTGATKAPINVTTSSGTTISIPQGTILKDANESPLSGNINVSVTTYSQQATSLLPSNQLTMNNKAYVPVVAFGYQVSDQSGKVAASFGNADAIISLPLNNVLNASTGQNFKAGDKGEFVIIDANGDPNSIGQASVVSTSASGRMLLKGGNPPGVLDNNLGVQLPMQIFINYLNGLSHETLVRRFGTAVISDIIRFLVSSNRPIVLLTVGIDVRGYFFNLGANYNPHNVGLTLKLTLFSALTDPFALSTWEEYVDIHNNGSFFSTPYWVSKAVVLMSGAVGEGMAVSTVLNNPTVSTQGNNSLPVTYAGLSYFDIFVQGKCPSDNTKIINPNVIVTIKKGNTPYGSISLSNGRAGIYAPDGTYILAGTYNNDTYSTTATITNGNVSIASTSDVVPMADAGGSNVHYYIMTTEACK